MIIILIWEFLTYLVNERSAVASAELWKKQTNNINKCLSLQFGNFKIAGLKCQPVVVGSKNGQFSIFTFILSKIKDGKDTNLV